MSLHANALPDTDQPPVDAQPNRHTLPPQPPQGQRSVPTPPSPHLSLVLSSFTRPARPPPVLNPSRLTIYTTAGTPHVLGCGTFGVVYPAMLDAVCPVAVKHLRPRPLLSNTTPVSRESARDYASRHARLAKTQFRREIRRYAELRTVPGVVRFYGLVGTDMFVIERLFGGPLSDVIRDSDQSPKLAPRCALRLAFMLAHALADIHRRGISHGDLKPSNVLLTEPLSRFGGVVADAVRVKLVDFGLSRRFQPVDDDDNYDLSDNDADDDDENFESNRRYDTFHPAKITQSVQLVARRFSCPISDSMLSSGLDTDLSDGEVVPTRKRASNPSRGDMRSSHHASPSTVTQLSGRDNPEHSNNDDSANNEDENDPSLPHQMAPMIFDARGTPAYLAPEGWCGSSALSRRGVSLKADVYALAMILYELECGHVPWHSMSEWSIFVAVCNHAQRPSWPTNDERVPGLRAIVERCWKQSYRDRPTCRQVAHHLGKLLEQLDSEVQVSKDEKTANLQNFHELGASQETSRVGPVDVVQSETPPTNVISSDAENGSVPAESLLNSGVQNSACTEAKSSNFIQTSKCVEYTTPPPSSPSVSSFISTPSLDGTLQSSRNTSEYVHPSPQAPYHLPTSPTRTSIHSFLEPDAMSLHPNAVSRVTTSQQQSRPRSKTPSSFSVDEVKNEFPPSLERNAIPNAAISPLGLLPNDFESMQLRSPTPKHQATSPKLRSPLKKTYEEKSYFKESQSPQFGNTRGSSHSEPPLNPNNDPFRASSESVSNNHFEVQEESTPKEGAYPYNELVKADDCSALCNALSEHAKNPKEVTFVLEAIGIVLSESQSNCIMVASRGTLMEIASILSKFGRRNSRMCKAVCFVILGLALSQNSVVEMKLRVSGACDMVLNCMRWHPADLPVAETGAFALNTLCRSSPAHCSVFVSQDGPATALRAIERAATTFDRDAPVASVGLEVLSATALHKPHALLSDGFLTRIFSHCDVFENCGIDLRLVDLLHTLIVKLPESRDKIVCAEGSLNVLSRIVDRTRRRSNWVDVLKQTCNVVSELAMSGKRTEAARAFLGSTIVESIMDSLRLVATIDPDSHDISVATMGVVCLRNMSGLGEDVCGSLQMNNVFDILHDLVAWAPNDRAIASVVSGLTVIVLKHVKSTASSPNTEKVRAMLLDMREKWRHDTKILESVNEAMRYVFDSSPVPPEREDKRQRNKGSLNAPRPDEVTRSTKLLRIFSRMKS